jgi:DNA replication factor GINS
MYKELFTTWKREKENLEIQKIAKDFYTKLVDFAKEVIGNLPLSNQTIDSKLVSCEFKNVEKMIKDLIQIRYEKISKNTKAEIFINPEFLTDEEEKICRDISSVAEYYQTLLKNLLSGYTPISEKKTKQKHLLIRFIQAVPAIVGSDLKTYGPFLIEDVATLPPENARILIRQGTAVQVDIE